MKKTAQLTVLESTIRSLGYSIRYEKGNFLGGDCRIRQDNVVVINKFLPIEGKIYTLAQVIAKINPPGLEPDAAKIVDGLVNSSLFSRENRKGG
jgi:hypothetical protein